jgi:predicted nucleotidyltransferase
VSHNLAIFSSIVEYNPFHHGHLYHLNKIKEFRDCEAVVVIMSGNFVQRGEPAIIDKWSRTEAALKNGVDLVIELPFVYSIQDARGFAYGAVSTLDKTGVIDKLVFGSESSKTKELKDVAKVLLNEPNELKTGIKKYLKEGLSFPNARKYALRDYLKKDTSILGRSNDILGLEYIYTLMKLGSRIEPITIKRVGANYNDKELSKIHSSATPTSFRVLRYRGYQFQYFHEYTVQFPFY